jgi:hypothetical protein
MQKNKFMRFILRAIDVAISIRRHRRVRWDQDPFQKATPTDRRQGWFFMALLPIGMTVVQFKTFNSLVDSLIHRSVVWLWLAVVLVICVGVLAWFNVGPKVPLFVSIPLAAVMWPVCIWLGTHH